MRYYLLLPAARMLDMWFRPRSEMMPLDTHFWEIAQRPARRLVQYCARRAEFCLRRSRSSRSVAVAATMKYLALLLTYPIVRSLFLATTGQSEDRYTMECFPIHFRARRRISDLVAEPQPKTRADHLSCEYATQQGRSI